MDTLVVKDVNVDILIFCQILQVSVQSAVGKSLQEIWYLFFFLQNHLASLNINWDMSYGKKVQFVLDRLAR